MNRATQKPVGKNLQAFLFFIGITKLYLWKIHKFVNEYKNMKGNRKMNKFGDFPFLVGVTSNRHAVKLENSTEAVADFICTKGVDGDLCILTPDGDKVLNTFGIYIDRCSDFDYLEKLRPVLVEKQMKLESSLGLGASL